MDNDKLIVKEILEGNADLFTGLVVRYCPKITSFLVKMGVDMEDARDLSQEVFIKAYNNLHKYSDNWEFSTWIFKIAVNTFKDFKKKRGLKVQNIEDLYLKADSFLPSTQLERLHYRETINTIFKSLDEDVKGMIVLKYGYDFTFEKIGSIYKKSPQSVKMKVLRARKKLSGIYGNIFREDGIYEM